MFINAQNRMSWKELENHAMFELLNINFNTKPKQYTSEINKKIKQNRLFS